MASPPRIRHAVSALLTAALLGGLVVTAAPAGAAPSGGQPSARTSSSSASSSGSVKQTVREARVTKRVAAQRAEAAARASHKAQVQAKAAKRAERRAQRKADAAHAAHERAQAVAARKPAGSKAAARAEHVAAKKARKAERAEQRAQVAANAARDAQAKADRRATKASTALKEAERSGRQALATATTAAGVKKARNAVSATQDIKATYVPASPLDGNHGRRIVYDKALMTVWLVGADDNVVARYPVVGRWDRPAAGEYTVYSQSPKAVNLHSKVTFDYMTRFAWGTADHQMSIGFHSIPRYYDGSKMHSTKMLGLPVATGGCVRMKRADARAVYRFADIGTRVVVLASPS